MTRRQLLGASLAGIIAALSLPFEQFAEWCKGWLGHKKTREPFEGINRSHFAGRKLIADPNCPRGKAYFFSANAWSGPIAYLHPRDHARLVEAMA